jgi:hypothetical protein
MRIPSRVRDGDTVVWFDEATLDVFGQPIDSAGYDLRYFLRANASGAAETLLGVADQNGWRFTWAVSEAVASETVYYWQAQAEKKSDASKLTIGSGSLTIEPSLAYVGTPGAYDGRSQAQKDLEAVQSAIRTLLAGGSTKEYRIGNRTLKRYDLAELIQLEGKLKADVAREKKAEMIANGLGSPQSMFVRLNA